MFKTTCEDRGLVCNSCQEKVKECNCCGKELYDRETIYCKTIPRMDCEHYCEECAIKYAGVKRSE